MTTPATDTTTPINTTGSASFADLGGREALFQAFAEPATPAETPPVRQSDPVPNDVTVQGASAEQGQTPTQETSQTQQSQQEHQTQYDPRAIEATVNQTVQQRLDELQRKNQYDEFAKELDALPAEDYKRVMKQMQQQTYSAQQIRQQVGIELSQSMIREVVTTVPELAKVSPEDAQKLNPANFNSPGQMTSAYIDYVANQRAEKLASKQTKDAVEAFKTEYIAKQAKKYPAQPSMQNGVPAGGNIDIEKATGRQLLEAAFATG